MPLFWLKINKKNNTVDIQKILSTDQLGLPTQIIDFLVNLCYVWPNSFARGREKGPKMREFEPSFAVCQSAEGCKANRDTPGGDLPSHVRVFERGHHIGCAFGARAAVVLARTSVPFAMSEEARNAALEQFKGSLLTAGVPADHEGDAWLFRPAPPIPGGMHGWSPPALPQSDPLPEPVVTALKAKANRGGQ